MEDNVKNNLKPKIYEKFRTIVDFSTAVKIPQNRITYIITGRAIPSRAEQRKIAKKLGCEIHEIFPAEN